MSITHVGSGHAPLTRESQLRQRQHRIGDQLRLTVLQRLDATRYQIGFPGGSRVVNSTVPLPVGATIRAVVTAVGEQLELQYQGTDIVAASMAQHEASGEDALVEYEQQFRVALSESDRAILKDSMSGAEDAQSMLAAGLFLGKLSLPLDEVNLQAVYESQRWPQLHASDKSKGQPLTVQDHEIEQLTNAVQLALHEPTVGAVAIALDVARDSSTSTAGDEDERQRREQARQLLNADDGGSVEYRYGVLPVLIADQLFELDLVYFRERQASPGPAAASKRMVMTLNAPSLGRVEVTAHAIGERVAVTIKTQSDASKQILATEQERVRELLERLGWGVDAVRYEVDSIDTRASAHVVEHVLNGDSLSRWA